MGQKFIDNQAMSNKNIAIFHEILIDNFYQDIV
jgi:hypothetical protein